MTIQMPYSKICGACSKSKNLQDFNRVTTDQRFFNRICKSCEELNSRKLKRPVMTLANQKY